MLLSRVKILNFLSREKLFARYFLFYFFLQWLAGLKEKRTELIKQIINVHCIDIYNCSQLSVMDGNGITEVLSNKISTAFQPCDFGPKIPRISGQS